MFDFSVGALGIDYGCVVFYLRLEFVASESNCDFYTKI